MTASIPALLQPLKGRLAAATPGPWEERVDDLTDDAYVVHDQEQVSFVASCGDKHDPRTLADAEFIAHAPTDQAKLIAAVEAVDSILAQGLKTISANPDVDDYERGFDDSTRGLTHKLRAALIQALGG